MDDLYYQASRFLAGVFGPLGPVEAMRAFDHAVDLAAARCVSVSVITEQLLDAYDRPDYLYGVSVRELHRRCDEYAAEHADLRRP